MTGRPQYHHGDLKEAAIAEGLMRVCANSDPQSLSLREIARTLGVSATALYRHFPDKEGLLGAIASRGFTMLRDAQEAAVVSGPEKGQGGDPLIEAGRAYVHFAFQYPALFRMIFAYPLDQTLPFETPPEESAAGVFARAVAARLSGKPSAEERYIAELRAWSQLHGLTMLILDGQLRLADIDALMARVIAPESMLPPAKASKAKAVPKAKVSIKKSTEKSIKTDGKVKTKSATISRQTKKPTARS